MLPLSSHEVLVRRIRGEFIEMPGLKLTCAQARRLWGLDDEACANVLDALTEIDFLVRTADGQYSRPSEGLEVPRRMAKTQLRGEGLTGNQGASGQRQSRISGMSCP